MDTEGVRLFVLASEKLNISAAGRELGMAPAVASAKLAKLEKALGADLLRRSTRKVALSLEGAEFLPYAREILAQENAAHAALGRGNVTATGTLRFTAPSTFAQLYIAPILPEFLALHPADDMRILCASPEYLNQHGTPTHPDELATHQLIAFKEQSPIQLAGRYGKAGQFNPRLAGCRLIVDDGLSQKIATIAGAGISMNALWSVHRELADGSLVRVLPDYKVDDQTALWLVFPKSNVLTAKVRIFIDFLLEKIGNAPVWTEA